MERKSPEEVFRNFGNCRISENLTMQPKITEIFGEETNEKEAIPGK